MIYKIEDALPVLRRTPDVVAALLEGLPDVWLFAIEGPDTWSPFDVLGHLIHGEKTDWMPRVEHLLAHGEAVAFPVFEREAMFIASRGRKVADLLDEFATLRRANLERLEALKLTDADLERRGLHPEFGVVTLGQHLATWVAHDMGHVSQMVRVMGRQYTDEVGPWRKYLSMLRDVAPPPAQ